MRTNTKNRTNTHNESTCVILFQSLGASTEDSEFYPKSKHVLFRSLVLAHPKQAFPKHLLSCYNRSEGSARTGYFIPGRDGMGGWRCQEILPPSSSPSTPKSRFLVKTKSFVLWHIAELWIFWRRHIEATVVAVLFCFHKISRIVDFSRK